MGGQGGECSRDCGPLALKPLRPHPCERRAGSGAEHQATMGLEVPARTELEGSPRFRHLWVPEAASRLPGQAAGPYCRGLATDVAESQHPQRS